MMTKILDISRSIATIPLRLVRAPFVAGSQIRRMANDTSIVGQARRAFVEDVAGRMRAVAGFLLGNERMLAAGQIERAKSAERLRAVAEEASADAIEQRAHEDTARRMEEAREQKIEAARKEAERTAAIARQTADEKRQIEADAALAGLAAVEMAVQEEIVIDAGGMALQAETERAAAAADSEELAAEMARSEAAAIEEASRTSR